MEILLWLVPSLVVAVLAMGWVTWLGRERHEVDRDEAVRRLGEALERQSKRRPDQGSRPSSERDRSTGVAVRPSRRGPVAVPDPAPETRPATRPTARSAAEPGSEEQRRVS